MSGFLPVMEMSAVAVALTTGFAGVARMRARYVRPHLKVTTGVVTGHKYVHGDEHGDGGYLPTLEFTIETGRSVRARAKGKPLSEPPEQGREVPVVYRRDRPDKWCYLGNLADYEQETNVGVWATFLGTALTVGLVLGLADLIMIMWG
ncbi:DUF3592 domain-containing protein [Streptomyces sp. NPDC002588]|uniref:DUF3592 domain-containing protein n=1 Tax=Streptomyces sp. NPDC002588 TaxID=3154419 RepID=UPI0033298A0B